MVAIDLGLSVMWGSCNIGAKDIYEEGMTQRVQEAHAELMAHYAGLDAKK